MRLPEDLNQTVIMYLTSPFGEKKLEWRRGLVQEFTWHNPVTKLLHHALLHKIQSKFTKCIMTEATQPLSEFERGRLAAFKEIADTIISESAFIKFIESCDRNNA